MRALSLDYLRTGGHTKPAAYVLAVIGAAVAVDVGVRYHALRADVSHMESRLASRANTQAPRARSNAQEGTHPEEYELARRTARQLKTPWVELFGALEAAQSQSVALLAVEPDAERRSVSISGEAKDYLAALSYVATLGEQKTLQGVRLVRHEVRVASPRSVAFVISAGWKDGP